MKKKTIITSVVLLFALASIIFFAYRQHVTKPLRILYTDWPPAYQLKEVARHFTEKTGIPVEVTTVPVESYQLEAYRDVDRSDPKYDIIISDSQWLGRNVVRGERYLEVTDLINKYNLQSKLFDGALEDYGEYPALSEHYYAVPFLADGMIFSYRKDLFEDPKEKKDFRTRYGYELTVPDTWKQLLDIAEFFNRPDKNFYGISMMTASGDDEVTMTFENVLFSFGGSIGDQQNLKAYGYINNKEGVTALEFFKKLFSYSSQAYGNNDGYSAPIEDISKNKAAMSLQFIPFYAPVIDKKNNPHADDIGFFAVPKGPNGEHFSALGGQGAAIVYHSKNQNSAKKFLEWWMNENTQREWVKVSGTTLLKSMFEDGLYKNARPYSDVQEETFQNLKDFWTAPEYPELLQISQKELYNYIHGTSTAKDTLDTIAKNWDYIFKTSPYNVVRKE